MNPFTLVRLPTLDAARERVAAEPERRTFSVPSPVRFEILPFE